MMPKAIVLHQENGVVLDQIQVEPLVIVLQKEKVKEQVEHLREKVEVVEVIQPQ